MYIGFGVLLVVSFRAGSGFVKIVSAGFWRRKKSERQIENIKERQHDMISA